MSNYFTRLTKIKEIEVKLRHKRLSIIKTAKELENVRKERAEISALMKKNQEDYFVKRVLSRSQFKGLYESNREQLADLDMYEENLRKAQKKEGFFRRLFSRSSTVAEIETKRAVIKPAVKKSVKKQRKKKQFSFAWLVVPVLAFAFCSAVYLAATAELDIMMYVWASAAILVVFTSLIYISLLRGRK